MATAIARGVLFGLIVMLPGCTKPEVKMCESHVLTTLKSPSTYKRISVSSIDESPMPMATFEARVGVLDTASDASQQLGALRKRLMTGHQIGIRTVAIEYDAENAFGTPIRSAAICGFALLDGEVSETLMSMGESGASARRGQRMLDELKSLEGSAVPDRPSPKFECCI